MKIRMTTLCAGPAGVLHADVIYDVEDHFGRALIEARAAVLIADTHKPMPPIEARLPAEDRERAAAVEEKKPAGRWRRERR